MADNGQPKAPSKGGENTLSLIGAIAGLAGNLIFGPDSVGIDFGAPFKAGAAMLKDKREQQSLLELLKGNPHTAPLAEIGPSLVEAGGLVKNPDILNHPQTQGYLSQFSMGEGDRKLVSPEMAQSPNNTVASVLAPQAQGTAPDYTSQEFLARAASLRPDLAEKIIASKATKDPNDQLKDMLQTVLLGKQIQNFETPEQKRRAALEDRQTLLDAQDIRIGNRQEQNQNRQNILQKSKITAKEEESFNTIDELRKAQQNILIDLESGVKPSYTKDIAASILPGGERALQTLDPNFSAFRKNINESLAIYQKAISGVAISEPEAKRLRPTQPQAGDDLDVLRGVAQNNIKKANEVYFIKAMNTLNRGGTDVYNYVDPQQLQLYKAVRAAMNHDLKGALASPKIQEARRQLGIDYGATNVGQ